MALSWGILDVSLISHDFVTALETLPRSQHKITSVAGMDKIKVNEFAELHKISTIHDNFDSLSTDDDINIVYIGAPNTQHYRLVKLMLENGKHVLCEKPLSQNYKETKELIELAKAKKLFLMEGMWSRFFPAYEALDKHIQTDGLGDVFVVNVQFGVQVNDDERLLMKELGGGIILDLGIYAIQFAQLVYKEKPTKVICAGHLGVGDVDESVSCILTYGDGKVANLTLHSKVLLPNEAVIVGTKGSLKLQTFWAPTILQTSLANITEWQLPKANQRFNFHNSAGLTYEAEECRKCILDGILESPKLTHSETLLIAEITEELQKKMVIP